MVSFELFHRLGDAASARVRKQVVALALEARASFRNVHFESHARALAELGTSEVPAIWDGQKLHVGETECSAFLRHLALTPASTPAVP
jgi:hypothetical protein